MSRRVVTSVERYYFVLPGIGRFRVPERAEGSRRAAIAHAIEAGAVICVAETGPVSRPTRVEKIWQI